jgi:hypothetical protein
MDQFDNTPVESEDQKELGAQGDEGTTQGKLYKMGSHLQEKPGEAALNLMIENEDEVRQVPGEMPSDLGETEPTPDEELEDDEKRDI